MYLQRYRSTKSFWNFPCAHRQHLHPGHCKLIHGYSRSFHFLFESTTGELDGCGFVMDFSGFAPLKKWLDDNFDHTLLLNPDDPLLPEFRKLEELGACKIVVVPTMCSMEGTARWIHNTWAPWFKETYNGSVELIQVEVRENDKNSGIFRVDML